jgi:hypothetical protein
MRRASAASRESVVSVQQEGRTFLRIRRLRLVAGRWERRRRIVAEGMGCATRRGRVPRVRGS